MDVDHRQGSRSTIATVQNVLKNCETDVENPTTRSFLFGLGEAISIFSPVDAIFVSRFA